MAISLIAAVAKNNVIGSKNDLPWYLPEDLKRFRKLTIGKPVLMGRKTFESIMKRLGKPLPGRKNVVVTRSVDFEAPPSVEITNSLEDALSKYAGADLFVIGGGQIFAQTIDQADTLYITQVNLDVPGDSFFPQIDPVKWKKVQEEKHDNYMFATYNRRVV